MDFVEKFLRDRADDGRLTAEKPLTIQIGPERKLLTLRCLPLDLWSRYQKLFGAFLLTFYHVFSEFDWPEWEAGEDEMIRRCRAITEMVALHTDMKKATLAIVRTTILRDPVNVWVPWWRILKRRRLKRRYGGVFRRPSWRYFKAHVTPYELMKIFLVVYQYNIAAVKKNALFLAKRAKLDLEACLFSSWRSLAGASGKFVRPRYPNSPYIVKGGSNPKSPKGILSTLEKPNPPGEDGKGGEN